MSAKRGEASNRFGVPNNRNSSDMEKVCRILAAMEDEERWRQELDELHGAEYFRVYAILLQYRQPKYSSAEFKGEVSASNEVTDKLRMMINSNNNDTTTTT